MTTLFERLSRVYKVNMVCSNCDILSEISIPKGITVEDYLSSEKGKCHNCGCSTIKEFKSKSKRKQEIDRMSFPE